MELGIGGRRAAVAASSAGLGYASAAALVAEGVRVTLCGSHAGRVREAAERLGGDTRWLVADLTVPDACAGFVEEATDDMGGLDILVVNGPGPPPGTVTGTPVAQYQQALERSLLSVVRMCLAAAPGMRAQGWGRIVAITSLGVRQPYPNLVLSNTARAGATGFLRTRPTACAAPTPTRSPSGARCGPCPRGGSGTRPASARSSRSCARSPRGSSQGPRSRWTAGPIRRCSENVSSSPNPREPHVPRLRGRQDRPSTVRT
jgi:3-oxoacyl-[acyl-carrier protein] reductase